jgi:telomerase reverse transcriptase
MAGQRKRTRHGGIEGDQKRQRIFGNTNGKDPVVKHAVLAQYYSQVFSLREYLLTKLPITSKIRRKKILKLGRDQILGNGGGQNALARFMDQTLIGVLKDNEVTQEERERQWTSFSQRVDISDSTFANLSGAGLISQSEVGGLYLLMQWNATTTTGARHWLMCS